MYIDEEKKFIFFHNMNAGGTSITYLLNQYTMNKYGKRFYDIMWERFNKNTLHWSCYELISIMPNQNWDQFFKFCFIRNPYTKIYSYFLQINYMKNKVIII